MQDIIFDRNIQFDFACGVRPIKAFHPSVLLQPDLDSRRLYLDMNAKTIWFYQYCAEHDIQGKIDCAYSHSENLQEIQSPEFVGGKSGVVKEFWTATIYLGGEAVSSATSSGTYMVYNPQERDSASNTLRKYAISAALMQAGFGVISAFNMTEADVTKLTSAGLQVAEKPTFSPSSPMEIQETFYGNTAFPPRNSAQAPQPGPVIQDTFFGSESSAAVNVPGNQSPSPTPAAPNAPSNQPYAPTVPDAPADPVPSPAPADPIVAAKQVMWVGAGKFKGKTLGEILSDANGLKNIAWIVNDFKPRGEEARQMQSAAKLILEHEMNK